MPKRASGFALGLVSLLTVAACSGAGGKPKNSSPSLPPSAESGKPAASPEEDPKAPGMIPKDCETLLNKSEAWGYTMGTSGWKPHSAEEALEVANFFSTFHLIPEATSAYTRQWLQETPPTDEAAAHKSLERMSRAQTCDLMLAHKLLLGLVSYAWGKAEKPKAAAYLHSFVLNQQARAAPSLARAVQLDILGRMAKRHLIRVDEKAVRKLQQWFDAETAKGLARTGNVATELEQWRLSREEVQLSEEARERLGKILPLP